MDHSENLGFHMVSMATSCTIFVWKYDFLSELCRQETSQELSAHRGGGGGVPPPSEG